MPSKIRIELNTKGIGELLKSQEMAALVEDRAQAVAGRADGNYNVGTVHAQTRVIATVEAADSKTRRQNLKNNTLLKALGGV